MSTHNGDRQRALAAHWSLGYLNSLIQGIERGSVRDLDSAARQIREVRDHLAYELDES